MISADKYIGMDVHQATISVAVLDSAGKLVMESILETKASTILQFIHGLRGNLYVTFEEGTAAAWLYDLLKPHVTKVVVCNPRKNAFNGSSHAGAQDRSDYFDSLEERRTFRRRTTETASSLSVWPRAHPWGHPWRWSVGFLRRSGSRVSIH